MDYLKILQIIFILLSILELVSNIYYHPLYRELTGELPRVCPNLEVDQALNPHIRKSGIGGELPWKNRQHWFWRNEELILDQYEKCKAPP